MRVVVIGAPGAGKSTITDHLTSTEPGVPTFGVRRHFAEQVRLGTPIGKLAEPAVRGGRWIPADVVVRAVREEIEAGRLGPHFILEGVPGNRQQAELLDELLDDVELPLDCAVYVRTPREVCLARATSRLVCDHCDGGSHQARFGADQRCLTCGHPVVRRVTDAQDRFLERLDLHDTLVESLVSYYTGFRLVTVDGALPMASMLRDCQDRLTPVLARASS